MELERGWRDRIGDMMFQKHEWKRVPTERFRMTVQSVLGKLTDVFSDREVEWLEARLYTIPHYERYNPVAIVLGYGCLEDHRLSPARFARMEKIFKKHYSWIKPYAVSMMDVLRYARRWDGWFQEKMF